MVRQSLEILDEIQQAAENVDEMRTEMTFEMYDTCQYIQKKSQKIVEAKLTVIENNMMGAASNVETVDSYLSLIDLINNKLEVFKQKYLALKAQAIEIFKQQLEEE